MTVEDGAELSRQLNYQRKIMTTTTTGDNARGCKRLYVKTVGDKSRFPFVLNGTANLSLGAKRRNFIVTEKDGRRGYPL